MKGEVTHQPPAPPARRLSPRNYMTFPRELRDAIPDLPTYVGRTLELAGTHGSASNTRLFGTRVHVDLKIRETGRLKGRFTVRMDLQVEAARALAANLLELADRAEKV
jgi:hypothetical protein